MTLRIGSLPGFVGKWVSRLPFSQDIISFELAATRANGPPANSERAGIDNEALCAISCAYGLETVTTVPPDTPVNVIQPRAPTVPPVGAHSRDMTVAQCPGCHPAHPGKWGGRQVPASPECRDRGWTCRSLGRQQKAFARSELSSARPKADIRRNFSRASKFASHRPEIGIYFPHTSSANSTIMRSLAHCSSSASTLPSSVDAKPHCGDRQS